MFQLHADRKHLKSEIKRPSFQVDQCECEHGTEIDFDIGAKND